LPPAARTAAEKQIAATKMSDEPLTHSSKIISQNGLTEMSIRSSTRCY
jgi:hypothetical protein